jgi:hypothetical protein
MRLTLKDISEKIEPRIVETIKLLDTCFRNLQIPFFLVGVGTRHVFFTAMYSLPTPQRIEPTEFVVRVKDWRQYGALVPKILLGSTIKRHDKMVHRFVHANGTVFEIIPFEGLGSMKGPISWAARNNPTDSIISFQDAFESAEVLRIKQNPPCDIKVCSPAALAISKLASWNRDATEERLEATKNHTGSAYPLEFGRRDGLAQARGIAPQSRTFAPGDRSLQSLGRELLAISKGETFEEIRHILQTETMPFDNCGLQMRRRNSG